jgi:hypothetical protein
VIGDASLEALLTGAELPAGSAPELRSLAAALAALTTGPASDELAGEASALVAFRDRPGPLHRARRPHPARRRHRRPALPLRLLSARAAAAAAAAAVAGLGGIATAAYAGALPAAAQRVAHDIIGAPAASPTPAGRRSPVGPDATGRSGYGLCTAWAHAKAQGIHKLHAVAFRNLAAAAGGASRVPAYCAAVAHRRAVPPGRAHPAATPHGSGRPSGLPAPHSSGKPSGLPTPHSSGKPTGLPTPHSSGKPSGLASPHSSGKPSGLPTLHGSGTRTAHA